MHFFVAMAVATLSSDAILHIIPQVGFGNADGFDFEKGRMCCRLWERTNTITTAAAVGTRTLLRYILQLYSEGQEDSGN
ncbi:unnamed protein product [Heligmosomoides polygyrus]|uniref:Secreted protein n=1 Tax=Heligmosomoides polygyrus TaxID=6339 RepID=A0A183FLT9_HELPZ|nr:unnamed protein product [Heligmosomoides polygyrus]